MSKLVVLNIEEGSFDEGFRVRLEIGEDGKTHHINQRVTLTPAPEVPRLYEDWKTKYHELGRTRQINLPPHQITNYSSLENCQEAARRLEDYLRGWFSQLPWRDLRVRIEENVQQDELVRVIINTENIYLKKLPWHLWDLFDRRQYAQFALRFDHARPGTPLKEPVRILAIFGGSQGIDLTSDIQSLKNLERQGAKVEPLKQPRRAQLSNGLWDKKWDILFFAGHSYSHSGVNSGLIQINDTETLSLRQLQNSLRTAVRHGLKLAIFNSCDGLGLAAELNSLGIPQMILMREPVPDEVARQFLQYFLNAFAEGKSFYSAVRQARERLEWMEDQYPCASWLPIICQNPAATPLLWPSRLFSFNRVGLKVSVVAIALILLLGFNWLRSQPTTITEPSPVQSFSSSWGEKIMIASNSNVDKEAGVKAYEQNNFAQAIENFNKSLKQSTNDPETLVYLNNAVSNLPIKTTNKLKNCVVVNQNTNEPLKIAAIFPISADSHLAEEVMRGVAQAQNEINCTSGIKGRFLQIKIIDDKGDTNIGEQVAQHLVKDSIIQAVIGHYFSSTTLKAGKIYDQKLVVVSPTSTAIRQSPNNPQGLDFSKYVFRTAINDEIAVKHLAEYMVSRLGDKEAAIAFEPEDEYSKSFRDQFQKQLESKAGKVIDVGIACNLDATFRANDCVRKATQNQAKVLLLDPGKENTLDKALQILDEGNVGGTKLSFLGGNVMYSEKTLAKGQQAEHMVVTVPWHRNESNLSEFEKDAQLLWGTSKVNWRTKAAYEATQVIAEGLRRNKNNPRQNLQKELSAPDFAAKGATGKVEFEHGDRKIDGNLGVLVEVQPVPGKKNRYDFKQLPLQ